MNITLPPNTSIIKKLDINNKANPVEFGANIALRNIGQDSNFEVFIGFDNESVQPQYSHVYHYYHQTLHDTSAFLSANASPAAAAQYTIRTVNPEKVIEIYSFGTHLDLAFLYDDEVFNRFNHTSVWVQVRTLSATTLMLYPPQAMQEKEYLNIKQQFNNNNNNNNNNTSSGNNTSSSKQQETQQQTSYAVEMDINPHGGEDDYFFGGDDYDNNMTSGTGGNVVNFDDDDDFRDDDDDNTTTTTKPTNNTIEDDDPFASDNDDDINNTNNNNNNNNTTSSLPPNHSQCPICRDAIPNLQYNRHVTFCANRYTVCAECNDKRYLKSTNHTHCEICHCITTEFYMEQHNLAYHRKIICECLHVHREEHVAKYGMGNPDHPFNPAPYIHTFQTIKDHKLTQCILRKQPCYYCPELLPAKDLQEHQRKCRKRTTYCKYCHKTVLQRKLEHHLLSAHNFDLLNLPDVETWQKQYLFLDMSAEVQHRGEGEEYSDDDLSDMSQDDINNNNNNNNGGRNNNGLAGPDFDVIEAHVAETLADMGLDITTCDAQLVAEVRAECMKQFEQNSRS